MGFDLELNGVGQKQRGFCLRLVWYFRFVLGRFFFFFGHTLLWVTPKDSSGTGLLQRQAH